MAQQRAIFLEGAAKRGADTKVAERLFDLMEKFAEYGFNKSHSAAYALIAYHTAWLKAYYPAEFMAATMSSEMSDTDKVRVFYEDCRANGLTMLPPDINLSGYRFEPVQQDRNPLWPGRDQGQRRGGDRRDRRRARGQWPVQGPVRPDAAGRQALSQPPRARSAGEGGRVRHASTTIAPA